MAFDQSGKYHMNPHHAKSSDAAQKAGKSTEPQPGPDGAVGKNGDSGTNPTKSAASSVDLGPAGLDMPMSAPAAPSGLESPGASALASMGSTGGKHMLISKGDDGMISAQHTGDTGEVEEPMQFQDLAALKDHIEMILGELTQLLSGSQPESQAASPVLGGY